jgi:hypothetical protein
MEPARTERARRPEEVREAAVGAVKARAEALAKAADRARAAAKAVPKAAARAEEKNR